MKRMNVLGLSFACLSVGLAFAASDVASDGWTPKFYSGLEAAGDVVCDPTGYRNESLAIGLKWTDGMPKFGVSKAFRKLSGSADWTVTAQVRCAVGGKAGAAIEFFDKEDRSLGLVEGSLTSSTNWTAVSWTFSAPARADHADVHLLSLDKAPVAFACVAVNVVRTKAKEVIPLTMKVLPVEWNRDWNGGVLRTLNFSDAPIPITVLMKGELASLKAPAFELDLPDELELKDAFCALASCYGKETPLSEVPFVREGRAFRRLRFEKLRVFGSPRAAFRNFNCDAGAGITLVIGPKVGGERVESSFEIVCRTCDGGRVTDERRFEMAFRLLPAQTQVCRGFFAAGWNCADRRFASTDAMNAALKAYEAAGLRLFRLDRNGHKPFGRVGEIRRVLESRPRPYVFAARLGDLWHLPLLMLTKDELKGMGGNLSKTSDAAGRRADKICPEFFTSDPAMRRQLDKAVAHWLEIEQVKDGDWVTMDMEPWQSYTYCYCDRCRKAFAAFAGLGHVPTMAEASAMKDAWAEFRVRHSAKSVEIIREAVMKVNPTLKLVDYDYVLDYSDPESRASFIRSCAKDTLMNEQWLDGHLCSYYHKIDRVAFDSMRNNVRHLKKFYIPMAGLSGYASWVRQGEVLCPRQIRQFALAAFVNGCPGYAFYSGNCFDGEVLLAMMEAQDEAAKWEDLPWGKIDGKTVPASASQQFAFASTVKPDGKEVIALFNYDPKETIKVEVADKVYELKPYESRFVVMIGTGTSF